MHFGKNILNDELFVIISSISTTSVYIFAQSMDVLKNHITRIISEYKEMESLLDAQKTAIVSHNLNQILQLVEKWHMVSKKREEAEKSFVAYLKSMFEQHLPGHPDPNLTTLLGNLDQADSELTALHSRLYEHLERLKTKQAQLNGLLGYVQDWNSQAINMMASTVKRTPVGQKTYTADGSSLYRRNSTLGIDRQG